MNGFLKSVLGWGSDERALSAMIRQGEKGVAGILKFAKYFVEVRGVDERLFVGKLSPLIEAMEKLYAPECWNLTTVATSRYGTIFYIRTIAITGARSRDPSYLISIRFTLFVHSLDCSA